MTTPTPETCNRCGTPVMSRVTTTGDTVVLAAHPEQAAFGLYIIRADLTVKHLPGFAERGYRVHTCPADARMERDDGYTGSRVYVGGSEIRPFRDIVEDDDA